MNANMAAAITEEKLEEGEDEYQEAVFLGRSLRRSSSSRSPTDPLRSDAQ